MGGRDVVNAHLPRYSGGMSETLFMQAQRCLFLKALEATGPLPTPGRVRLALQHANSACICTYRACLYSVATARQTSPLCEADRAQFTRHMHGPSKND